MRHWTIVGLIVVLAGLFGATGRAVAQSPSQPVPPEHYTLDPRGVDLVTGIFSQSSTDVVIGQPGAGGLSHTRGNTMYGWRDAVQGSLGGAGTSVVTVVYGLEAEVFTLSGGVYTAVSPEGATLTQSGADYIYTTGSGVVVKYTTTYCYTATGNACTTGAYLYEVTTPTGEKTTYTYTTQTYLRSVDTNGNPVIGTVVRLAGLSNNRGYQLSYTYAANTVAGTGTLTVRINNWMRVTKITGSNLAYDFASQTWPSATYGYPASGDQTVTDQAGRTTTYLYNGLYGSPVGIRYPGSSSNDVTIAYTGSGGSERLASVTDATGTWNYSYTDYGSTRVMNVSGPLGEAMSVTSDQTIGRATSVTQTTSASPPVSRTWTYHYDGQRRLDQITNPEGDYTVLVYDARGNMTSTVAHEKPGVGTGTITTSVTYPANCTSPYTPANCNKPVSTTDARGQTTDYAWDATYGVLASVTAPAPTSGADRPQTRYGYSNYYAWFKSGGTLVQAPTPILLPDMVSTCATGTAPSCVGTANETRTTVAYGSSGVANNLLPTGATQSDGTGALSVTATTSWDHNGDRFAVDGPLAGTGDYTRYRYDVARQLVGVVGPDPDLGGGMLNRAQRITYNTRGQVTLTEAGMTPGYSDTDWSNFSVLQRAATEYDSWSRPVVSRSQDASGNTLALQQVGYDAAGRAQCAATRMNPGAFGSVPATSACSLGANGAYGPDRIIQMTYDAADRPISSVTGVGTGSTITESVSYTANGQTASATDGNGNVSTFAYDGFDRVFRQCYPGAATCGSATPTVYEEYGYDAGSNLTAFRNRAGEMIYAGYDYLNRRVTLGGSAIADRTYSYDNLSRPLQTAFTGGGLSSTKGWDALSRLTSETQGTLGTVNYGYDNAGRRIWISWPDFFYASYEYNYGNDLVAVRENGNQSWALQTTAYDNLGRRIATGKGNGVVSSWSYDGIGRLAGLSQDMAGTSQDLTLGFAYNPAGQIISRSVSNSSYVYTPASTAIAYVNNILNQMTSINGSAVGYADGRGNITSAPGATYGYNAENQLSSAVTSLGSSGYAYDPTGRLYQAIGGTNRRFLYDGHQVIAEYNESGVIQNRYVPGASLDDVVTSYDSGGNRTWQLSDERGSVVGLTNGSGASTAINTYDEYGVPGASNTGRFQYTGQMWLPDAQLYHYRARAYAPQIGRFMQTDPLGYGAGANIYAYVGGDPMNAVDPMGTCPPNDPKCDVPTQVGGVEVVGQREVNCDWGQTKITFGGQTFCNDNIPTFDPPSNSPEPPGGGTSVVPDPRPRPNCVTVRSGQTARIGHRQGGQRVTARVIGRGSVFSMFGLSGQDNGPMGGRGFAPRVSTGVTVSYYNTELGYNNPEETFRLVAFPANSSNTTELSGWNDYSVIVGFKGQNPDDEASGATVEVCVVG